MLFRIPSVLAVSLYLATSPYQTGRINAYYQNSSSSNRHNASDRNLEECHGIRAWYDSSLTNFGVGVGVSFTPSDSLTTFGEIEVEVAPSEATQLSRVD